MAFTHQNHPNVSAVHKPDVDQLTTTVVITEPFDRIADRHQFQHAIGCNLGELRFPIAFSAYGIFRRINAFQSPFDTLFPAGVTIHQTGHFALFAVAAFAELYRT